MESFDTVVVGTGFASTFFLREYLRLAPLNARVLVLERGRKIPYAWKVEHGKNSDVPGNSAFINKTPAKPWLQNIAFGGGACWTGNTPRPHPSDFEMKSRYGIGEDWPISYADLEPYMVEVEGTMGIAGSGEGPFPRSKPYPAQAHRLNGFDRAIAAKYPGEYIAMPSARASSGFRARPSCCGNGICSTCPITAKFQIDLHMTQPYDDPRVTLRLQSTVERLDVQAQQVTGVFYRQGEEAIRVACDLAVVGAHGISSPHILLRSGLTDKALGKYLHESFSMDVQLNLDGLDSLDGSQAVTGLGIMFHDRPSRATQAACNIESFNNPWLRAEPGRWRQRALLKFVFEDLPSIDNYVGLSAEDESKPEVYYPDISPYTRAGMDGVAALVEELIDGLPVEDYVVDRSPQGRFGSDAHIQGTTRMGNDPATSVVDANLVHHSLRNLAVLGSGAFPSCPAANPTLILSALSIRAARKLVS